MGKKEGDAMKKLARGLFVLAGLSLSLQALAQAAAVVEGVQMPAWVEREGRRTPLAPGMELRMGDALRTGAGSRLLLRLGEGSLVKVGENGNVRLAELTPAKEVFKGVLGVLEGAFRFTTQKIGAQRRRDINIHVSQVTAGIRGTDLWGRSRDDNQIVCLIEGRIEVGAPNETAVMLDQPLQFYQRERGQTKPVGFVDPKQLGEWAKETEIEAGKGAARLGGRFRVELGAAENPSQALALYDQLRDAGYAAEILPVGGAEKRVYLLRIRNLPSRVEAESLAGQLRGKHGVSEPRVAG
jgi:hypothetical protein